MQPTADLIAAIIKGVCCQREPEMRLKLLLACAMFTIKEVPAHLRQRDLLTGYQGPKSSAMQCLKGVLSVHNQTLNVWSALLLVAFNVCMGLAQWNAWRNIDAHLVQSGVRDSDAGTPFGFWIGRGAVPGSLYAWLLAHIVLRALCWIFSAGYHILDSHESRRLRDLWQTLDFLGIYTSFIGMGGNAINALCLATCAAPGTRVALLGCGTVFSCAAIAVSFTARFRADNRVCGGVFGIVMASYVLPITALGMGLPGAPLRHLVSSCTAAACGGLCFVARFPERFIKRHCDIWAPSHSLWHWSNAPHDFFVLCFTWELSMLALTQGFACPAHSGAANSVFADALALYGHWWY